MLEFEAVTHGKSPPKEKDVLVIVRRGYRIFRGGGIKSVNLLLERAKHFLAPLRKISMRARARFFVY